MKKRTIITILGLWVAVIPSLGLPGTWKNWIIIISGLLISMVAFKRRRVYMEIEESDKNENISKA
jgi:hypothetical protein